MVDSIMVKFTRRHYIEIGNTIKKLPKSKRQVEFRKWNKIFKADNPRYKPSVFKKFVGL